MVKLYNFLFQFLNTLFTRFNFIQKSILIRNLENKDFAIFEHHKEVKINHNFSNIFTSTRSYSAFGSLLKYLNNSTIMTIGYMYALTLLKSEEKLQMVFFQSQQRLSLPFLNVSSLDNGTVKTAKNLWILLSISSTFK